MYYTIYSIFFVYDYDFVIRCFFSVSVSFFLHLLFACSCHVVMLCFLCVLYTSRISPPNHLHQPTKPKRHHRMTQPPPPPPRPHRHSNRPTRDCSRRHERGRLLHRAVRREDGRQAAGRSAVCDARLRCRRDAATVATFRFCTMFLLFCFDLVFVAEMDNLGRQRERHVDFVSTWAHPNTQQMKKTYTHFICFMQTQCSGMRTKYPQV